MLHTFYYVSTDVIGATVAAATGGVVGILLIIVVVVIVVCVLHLHKKVSLYISWCLHQLIIVHAIYLMKSYYSPSYEITTWPVR